MSGLNIYKVGEIDFLDKKVPKDRESHDILVGGDLGDVHIGWCTNTGVGVLCTEVELRSRLKLTDEGARGIVRTIVEECYESIGPETFRGKK